MMLNPSGNIVNELLSALTGNGLCPEIEDFGAYSVVRVGGADGAGSSGDGSGEAIFIVVDPSAESPQEAERLSEAISVVLSGLRSGGAGAERTDGGGSDLGAPKVIGASSAPAGPKVMVVPGDLWRRRSAMMRSRVLAHCGIFDRVFARNCEVRRLDRPQANAFMDANHSYGAASCRHCYGLFTVRRTASKAYGAARIIEPGTLVAAAEFSNARRWQKDGREIRSYEWVRYASLPGVRINGGMGKILQKFIADVNPDDIMSYADLEWSDGEVYRRLGFTPDGSKAPVLFTIDPATAIRFPLGSRKSVPSATSAPAADKKIGCQEPLPDNRIVYYQNFGSIKYRLQRY